MMTGTLPFSGGSALSVAAKRLTHAPPRPSLRAPELDPAWESVILRCLARAPQDRFESVLDVPSALREASAARDRVVGLTQTTPDPPGEGDGRYSVADRSFPVGELVAGRYRVVRFIAAGGMGEVYEVEDLELGGHLALKTIQPNAANASTAIRRFKREISLARKITHPNACRIYDMGTHETGPGSGGVLFLTMELLAGETLASHAARKRRWSMGEALPLIEQMAAALHAGHAAGIIHRDFKSGNVVLVEPRDPAEGVRAVVTDFGLARPAQDSDLHLTTISGDDVMVGTPAYMAPEQVQGKTLTSAADIYALGIVIYEMVTGVRPFDGGSALTVATKRLIEAPPAPRLYAPDLDPGWEAAILRCLEREPSDRFDTALEVARAFRDAGAASPPSPEAGAVRDPAPRRPGPARRELGRAWKAAATLLLVAGLSAVGYWARGRITASAGVGAGPDGSTGTGPVVARRSLAVLGFQNVSAREDKTWLGTAIAEMLTTDLGAGDAIRVVPTELVEAVRRDLGVGQRSTLSRDQLLHARRALAADFVVDGSYTLVGEGSSALLRVDLRLHDTASGELVESSAGTGTERQLFDLLSRAGASFRRRLGLSELSPAQALTVEASLPSDAEAARLYSEGLGKLRSAEAIAARDLLEQAVAKAPEHAMLRAALARAWSQLGYEGRALEEARKAATLSDPLPEQHRLLIEAQLYETSQEWPRAVQSYRELRDRFPDDVGFALRLANAQTRAGGPDEALVTIEAIRALALPASEDPRVDLEEARAFAEKGDYKRLLELAGVAAEKARSAGSASLEARARLQQAGALYRLGDLDRAMEVANAGGAQAEAIGDQGLHARFLEYTAMAVNDKGDLGGAARLLERAAEIHRGLGDKTSVGRILINLGNVRLAQGSLDAAQSQYDEALTLFTETGARLEAAQALNGIGAQLLNRGELRLAQEKYQAAIVLLGELGERLELAAVLTNVGEIAYLRGDLTGSRGLHEEALAINREAGDMVGVGYDLFRLGVVFGAAGDFAVATRRFEEAIRTQERVGDAIGVAETRLNFAEVKTAAGEAEAAESLSRQAEQTLRAEGAADLQTLADLSLADSLLAQGRAADARAVIQRAELAARETSDQRVRLGVVISSSRIRAASGEPGDAAASLVALDQVTAEATKVEYVAYALEARLAAGSIAHRAGLREQARARLAKLADDAESHGFTRIQREARAILNGS